MTPEVWGLPRAPRVKLCSQDFPKRSVAGKRNSPLTETQLGSYIRGPSLCAGDEAKAIPAPSGEV